METIEARDLQHLDVLVTDEGRSYVRNPYPTEREIACTLVTGNEIATVWFPKGMMLTVERGITLSP